MSPFQANLVSGMSTGRVSCLRDTRASSRVRNNPGGRMAHESRCATADVEEAPPRPVRYIQSSPALATWVGSAEDANGVSIPVFWHGGTIQTLGESDGFAADITNAGVVVGTADVDSASSQAFWWYRGTPHVLPVPSWATSSYVRRIN